MHLNCIARAAETPLPLHLYPLDQRVQEGEPVSWYLTTVGSEPLEYQWKLNGKEIPGANANVLRIASVKTSDQGLYTCQIKNSVGSIETEKVALAVNSGTALNTAQKVQPNKAPAQSTAQQSVPVQE